MPARPRTEAYARFAREEIEQSIQARFERQARRRPGAVAVSMDGCRVTYAGLAAHANGIAGELLAAGGPREAPVGLLLRQSTTLPAAILGVLGAGRAYLPLDPDDPPSRSAETIAAAGVGVLVAHEPTLPLARSLAGTVVDAAGCPPADVPPRVSVPPGDTAYVFATSGSTGRPKLVADSHRNVLHNVMRYTNSLRIGADDRLSLLQGAAYSGSVSSLFCALLNGATVCPYDVARDGLGTRFARWLEDERITIYHSVPALFRALAAAGARLDGVRIVRLEGDAATSLDVSLYKERCAPVSLLVNGLGATETGLTCQLFVDHDTAVADGVLPVGRPTEDMEVLLLTGDGGEAPAGEAGEITIRSDYLALGYVGDPERTAQAFLRDPDGSGRRVYRTGDLGRRCADGTIAYLGRKEHAPKIRGHRVDTTEIENALLSLPGVAEAVVTTGEDGHGRPRLVAHVVPLSDGPLEPAALRGALAARLPSRLVPTAYAVLDSLPLNGNGKVDRRRLPAPEAGAGPLVAPGDDVERKLVEVWQQTLGVGQLGVTEDFFDLGGDSLSAAELLAAVEQAFGLADLPASLLAEAPTVAMLAERLGRNGDRPTCLVPLQPLGSLPPLFCVPGHGGEVLGFAPLGRAVGPDQPLYGLRSPGLVDRGAVPRRVEDLAARYLDEVLAVRPDGPYRLAGVCFGGLVAFELARLLLARGHEVAPVALIDNLPCDFAPLVPPREAVRFRRHQQRQRVRYHARRLAADGVARVPLNLAHSVERVVARTRLSRRLRGRGNPSATLPVRLREMAWLNQRAAAAYVPRRLDGALTVVSVGDTLRLYRGEPAAAWDGVASGPVRVVAVGTGARDVFRPPLVNELAAALARSFGPDVERARAYE